jgi:hypothetical protein
MSGNRNRSVTHAPRHLLASQVQSIATPLDAGNVLHHKSKSSIDYYPPVIPPVPTFLITLTTPENDSYQGHFEYIDFAWLLVDLHNLVSYFKLFFAVIPPPLPPYYPHWEFGPIPWNLPSYRNNFGAIGGPGLYWWVVGYSSAGVALLPRSSTFWFFWE